MKRRAAIITVISACILIAGCADMQQATQQTQCYYGVLQAEPGEFTPAEFDAKMASTVSVLESRLDKKGLAKAAVLRQGADTIRVELPVSAANRENGLEKILKEIITPGLLEFKNAAGETKLTGAMVSQAWPSAQTDYTTGAMQYVVSFKFNDEGTKLFGDLTKEAYENNTDITLTLDGAVISVAGVNQGPIYGGEAVIEGSFTEEEVQNLAMQIESGALPLQLKLTDCGTGISENPR